jgi:hypothetical protein
VGKCEAAMFGFDRTLYQLEKMISDHGIIWHSLAVKLLQSFASFLRAPTLELFIVTSKLDKTSHNFQQRGMFFS